MNRNKSVNLNETVIILVGEKGYEATRRYAVATIDLAKEKHKGTNALLAIEKKKIITLKKDFFASKDELMKVVESYKRHGYKATYTASE
jgi:hypothetical protein